MTVKNAVGSVVASYYYDALGRRMVEVSNGVARRFYHSLDWQVVEASGSGGRPRAEQEAISCTCGVLRTRTQYVWGLGFVDELVLRDNDADANAATGRLGNNGNQSTGPLTGLEERLYAQQDANYNVTSLTSTSGAVQERYLYDPYGSVTYRTSAWGSRTASSYNWAYLHQGGRWDADAGLYHFRNRDYSPTLGRWVQPDPAGYVDGMSLYQALGSNPASELDPLGLKRCPTGKRRPPGNPFSDFLNDAGQVIGRGVNAIGNGAGRVVNGIGNRGGQIIGGGVNVIGGAVNVIGRVAGRALHGGTGRIGVGENGIPNSGTFEFTVFPRSPHRPGDQCFNVKFEGASQEGTDNGFTERPEREEP